MKQLLLLGLLGLSLLTNRAVADTVEMHIPPGNYTRQLGKGSIADPSGATHTRKEVAGKVVVAIFSAPNMSQGDRQQKWADLLAENPKTKLPDHIALFLVEDISQAGMFKGMALADMKKEFTPHSRPFLILDQTGDFFKKYGVPRNKTEILIYDKNGRLRDVETDLDDDEEKTLHRIHVITQRLYDN